MNQNDNVLYNIMLFDIIILPAGINDLLILSN